MPIRLSCPRCQRAMQIDDRYAGRAVKCPGCAMVLTAPSVVPTPVADAPFAFGGGGAAGQAFDFDAPSPPVDDKFLAFPAAQAEGWRNARVGLNMIGLGSGLQVLTVTVWLVTSIIFGTGVAVLSSSRDNEPPPVNRQEAGKVAGIAVAALVLGTLAIGTIVRLIGFFRCLATPAESGAKGLAIGAFSCEMLVLASSAGRMAAEFLALSLVSMVVGLLSLLVSLVGLVVLLLYLRQIGVALGSKQLRGKVRSFVIWLGVGIAGFIFVTGSYLVLFVLAASGGRPTGAPLLAFGLSCFSIAFVVIVGLMILLRYLGLFTTAADEIKRCVGK